MARKRSQEAHREQSVPRHQEATPEKIARALKRGKLKPANTPPDGNKTAFGALLRRAIPDEADRPEGETSDPA